MTAIALFGLAGVSPAYAEEVSPAPAPVESTAPAATTEPVPEPTSEPVPAEEPAAEEPPAEEPPAEEPPAEEPPPATEEPPPTDPSTPPPTDPSTPPPTDPSTPPPTDPSTPPPTDPSTPPPTDPSTPPPTDPSTPPPADPSTPPPAGPSTPAPPTFSGSGSTYRSTTTSRPAVDTQRTAALAAAQLKVDRAVAALREAESALADGRAIRDAAQATAERLQAAADQAMRDAEGSRRVYIAATQGDGATISSIDAVFGAGKDLLAGLGGVARVEQIAGDAEKFLAIANEKAEAAAAAQARADEAFAAVDAVPIEALEADVASAEQAVADARKELEDLRSRPADRSLLASSGSSLILSLPADAGQLSDQGWAHPVTGRITDGFGPRPNQPVAGVNPFHRGTDVAASCGTPIFAATSGVVIEAQPYGTYGNWILIDHGSGVSTGYAHLASGGTFVSAGQSVTAGQLIGAVGSTGASTGCHLHLEVRLGGTAVDAVPFMAARGINLG